MQVRAFERCIPSSALILTENPEIHLLFLVNIKNSLNPSSLHVLSQVSTEKNEPKSCYLH